MLNQPNQRSHSLTSAGGFTLIELMVVAAIIAILAAVGIPNILRSRMASNEAAAMVGLKTISSASELYYNNNNTYPQGLSDLAEPQANPPYIDAALASGEKQGYKFVYASQDAQHFAANANPVSYGITGARFFYIDEAGVMRSNPSQEAGPDDPVVS